MGDSWNKEARLLRAGDLELELTDLANKNPGCSALFGTYTKKLFVDYLKFKFN